MKNRPGDELAQWLYQSKIGSAIYAWGISGATTIIFDKKLKEDFLNFIPKGGKILEIGCGPGNQAIKILKDRHDLEIIASDMSSEMISQAQKKYQEMILRDEQFKKVQSNLSFVQADAMDLSQFDSETFDGIYSYGVIKHFPDRIRGLNECIRILKPGGRMFFDEFFAEASLAQTMNLFAKHIRIPAGFMMKPIISRIFHNKHKISSPDKADIEQWEQELSSKGVPLSEYLQEYPFFILKFEKN